MTSLKRLFLQHWPVVVLLLVTSVLFLTNYAPGTYLLGWDSTTPELNLPLNLSRILFGVWQEYRGLGTLDGMAHTANIMYWLYTAGLAVFLPTSLIRYVTTLGFHFLGGLGIYFLIKDEVVPVVLQLLQKKEHKTQQRFNFIALFSALFYMFNLMTIQMFYTPLELFSIHFAVLPWGILTLQKYLKTGSVAWLIGLFLVNLLGVSQAHVPTIFISYALGMGLFFLFHLFTKTPDKFKRLLLAGLVFIGVNAFWGLPYTYSALHKSNEIAQAKQNRLGTDGTFYRNFAWGDARSVFTFGGFQLDYQDWYPSQQKFDSIMAEWVKLYRTPTFTYLSFILSGLSVLGGLCILWLSFRRRQTVLLPFLTLWFFSLAMLGNNIPMIGQVSAFARAYVPLFYQIFRFTFTKFSILYVCSTSILSAVLLIFCFSRKISKLWFRISFGTLMCLGFASLVYLNSPAFAGFFFYPALRVRIPRDYQNFFTYFNTQDAIQRTATFPIHSLWGWTTGTNNWGYRGSGFMWQIMQYPLVDRSFDPWSKYNETEFLQLNRALYNLDSAVFTATLEKFGTNGLLQDESVFQPGNYPEALFTVETDLFLQSLDTVELNQKFGPLNLYQAVFPNSGLTPFAPSQVTVLSDQYQTEYTTRDQAFLDQGNYLQKTNGKVAYPFSYLQADELTQSNQLRRTNQAIVFPLQVNPNQRLFIPEFTQTQASVVVKLNRVPDPNLNIQVQLQTPKITLPNGSVIQVQQPSNFVTEVKPSTEYFLAVGNELIGKVISPTGTTLPASTIINASTRGVLKLGIYTKQTDRTGQEVDVLVNSVEINLPQVFRDFDTQVQKLTATSMESAVISFEAPDQNTNLFMTQNSNLQNCRNPQQGQVEVKKNPDSIVYAATQKAIFCDNFFLPELDPDMQYLLFLKGKTHNGAGAEVLLLSGETKRFDIYTSTRTGTFDLVEPVYPSQGFQKNNEYAQLIINGQSHGTELNQVEFDQIQLIPMPLNWLTGIYQAEPISKESFTAEVKNVKKVGSFLYQLQFESSSAQGLLVLPQSFDEGWVAFAWPNRSGQFEHLKYNGWANGWLIPQGEYQVIILYWPQLLSFAGYGLLAATMILLGVLLLTNAKRQPQLFKQVKATLKAN